MVLTCFIYNWELFINDDSPIIIGFGYNKNNDKIAVVIKDFPLFKYSESINMNNFNYINNKKEVLHKRLLRHYLDGEKKVYKVYFKKYSEYASFHTTLFNVDLVSSFLSTQNLDTIGWIYSNVYQKNEMEKYTTFNKEYIISYKDIHEKKIDNYPEPSILSFDIECMSHDFESFPNCYLYNDYISTVSIVYHYKDIQRNIAICVKYKDKNNIVNRSQLNEISPSFISFIDINKFNNSINNNKNNKNDNNNNSVIIKTNDIEVEKRYHRLKALLNNNNCTYNCDIKSRFNRLKSILNNSLKNEKLIKNSLNSFTKKEEEEESSLEPIEEFIMKHEKSKKDKILKSDILNDKYDIIFVESEYDLICEFFNQIRKLDPDLIIGYNTFGFDYKYLAQRAGMYSIIDQKDSPFKANRILNMPTKFMTTSNNEVELKIPGRITIDIFKYAKSLNMPSASLNYVSEQLLNKHKIDLPFKDMFYLIYENTNDSLNKVAMYCIMDSILTLEIFNISYQWIQLLEIAKTSRIRVDEVYKNGQSKKFANLLYKYCYDNNICIDIDNSDISSYKGATVIEPLSGVYNYCTMLDFTSLYPSVIITHNICYTTLIHNSDIGKYAEDEYHKIDIGNKVYYFTKSHVGILPRMMKLLLSERIRYKNMMKKASGSDYIIYDKRQYALKIQANSIYGCLGSGSLKYLRFLPGAECTTGMGRNYLNKTIALICENTKFRVIYGDTDSCLIEYKKDVENKSSEKYHDTKDFNINKFIEDCKLVAEYVTDQLPEGMHLKYENTFKRMLIISKKKYCGVLANTSELYIKGIDIIKKNTCIFIRDYYKIFLYMILFDYPENLIRNKVLEMKNKLLSGDVPLEKLIMKLSIGPKYVNKSYYVLLFVNNHKMYNLDYKVGEKVEYIIIDTNSFAFNENSKLLGDKMISLDLYKNICEKATKNKNISKPKLDYQYYYYHYVETGFKSLLKVLNTNISDLL
ncbi:DNA/RNA polymerase [Piromyces finnis]|uniref:DNA polymerase delta catalytic subunit n=1 Tax=Piromyces finnis TaxID=1754191 RepID=A0A1Y1UUE8_9FUNG|nr:DNA/RNA polymerase [Piromyces finnis]|eukprot:ORX41576.1 DNA/RNA polymerase [Piromyces finnis]